MNNQHGYTIGEKELYSARQNEGDRKFGQDIKSRQELLTGFTVLEVMVALAIMAVSLSIFFSLVGNSSKLRGRIDDHIKLVLLARTKTEEAFLGILEKAPINLDEKKIFEGKTKNGIQWKVVEVDTYKEEKERLRSNILSREEDNKVFLPKGIILLNTEVGGIIIDTVFSSPESKDIESEDNKKITKDKKEKSLSE